jgi:hypothetical protein
MKALTNKGETKMNKYTFLELFDALPYLVHIGHKNIDASIERMNQMHQLSEDEAQKEELEQLLHKAHERNKFIDFLGSKIQDQIKFLQFNCLVDNDLPADKPNISSTETD